MARMSPAARVREGPAGASEAGEREAVGLLCM